MPEGSVADKFTNHILKEVAEGRFAIGESLPPERELSKALGISRTVVHSGIAGLAAIGLLRVVPRKGTFVNDYRRHGSIELLNMLLMQADVVEKSLFKGIMDSRKLFETRFAYLAALNRTEEELRRIKAVIKKEEKSASVDEIAKNDFLFHQEIAFATANPVYPLILKSMEGTYINLVREFYMSEADRAAVLASHKDLYAAIKKGDPAEAERIMENILAYGELYMPK